MKILLDTNVLAYGIAGARHNTPTPSAQIWRRWRAGEFELVHSAHILEELKRVLVLPWFAARLNDSERKLALAELDAFSELIEITAFVAGVTGHWQDDLVLAAAVSGDTDYLVTRDKEFRRVDEYEGVKIRTPAEFLADLEADPA